MGFCSRCGEPCTLAVCSCGGLAKTPAGHKVLYSGRSVTPDTDRWERRYVQRSPATTPKTLSRTLPEAGANNDSTSWQAQRPKHLSLPAYAMAGRNFEDVETLKQSDAGPSNRAVVQARDRIVSTREVQEVEETISRAFGSVLDPAHQRRKWKCHDCNVTFVRDQKVYPDPRAKTDSSLESDLYCPACFAGKFSLGVCVSCREAVLPDAATPFVQRKDKLWHATCYACLYCAADLSKNPQVDLYGNPCCAECFDNAAFLKDPTVERVPALLSANRVPQHDLQKQQKEEQRRNTLMPSAAKLGPAVNELKTRLTDVGLDSTPSKPSLSLPANASLPHPQPISLLSAKSRSVPAAHAKTGGSQATSGIIPEDKHVGVNKPQVLASSPRAPITSPRIAACKAFFDGNTTSGPEPRPASKTLSSGDWNRPSPSPIQRPAWQRHAPSHSMPFIPKTTSPPPSGPEWLKSPILAGNAAVSRTSKEARPVPRAHDPCEVSEASLSVAQLARPSARVTRPLPAPPSTLRTPKEAPKDDVTAPAPSISQASVPLVVPNALSAASQVISTSKKVSAGILSRSKSFRRTGEEVDCDSNDAHHQSVSMGLRKSFSTGELPYTQIAESRPSTQRALAGLSRSNAVLNSKSSVKDKLVSNAADPTRGAAVFNAGRAADAGLSEEARCSGCRMRLFGLNSTKATWGAGHTIVVLPNSDAKYHARCFTCDSCKKPFEDGVFVDMEEGKRVHEKCAPPQVLSITHSARSSAANMPMPSKQTKDECLVLKPSRPASKMSQQYVSAAQVAPMSPSKTQAKARPSFPGPAKLSKASEIFASRDKALSSPVFGGMYHCAGCGDEGTLAETTLGPVGTRFHHRCLRCACGKQLDSGAKGYEEVGPSGRLERRFACRTCIDNRNLAKRSLSSMAGMTALRG